MSDTNTASAAPENIDVAEHENDNNDSAIPAEPIVAKEENFTTGDWNGFKFFSPQFGSIDKAVEHFGANNILAMLNAQVSSRIRTKVKNGLPKNLKGQEMADYKNAKLKKSPDGVLFTQEQALAWRPDTREETSNSIFKDIKKAMSEGRVAEIPALFQKFLTALQGEGGNANVDLAALLSTK